MKKHKKMRIKTVNEITEDGNENVKLFSLTHHSKQMYQKNGDNISEFDRKNTSPAQANYTKSLLKTPLK